MKLYRFCVCLLLGMVTTGCSEPVAQVAPNPHKVSVETQDCELRLVDDWLVDASTHEESQNA